MTEKKATEEKYIEYTIQIRKTKKAKARKIKKTMQTRKTKNNGRLAILGRPEN